MGEADELCFHNADYIFVVTEGFVSTLLRFRSREQPHAQGEALGQADPNTTKLHQGKHCRTTWKQARLHGPLRGYYNMFRGVTRSAERLL
jgi:hypothetical protein